MEKKLYRLYFTLLYLSLTVFLILGAFRQADAQTPGFIYKAATGGGEKVLDPNGDGYVSTSKTGFTSTNDIGASVSEIPYRPLPVLETEPLGDLNTGNTGGHTDLAPPSPIQTYFDGTNVMFRLRLGGSSTASKGYSVLIDTDGKFGDLVAGGNPTTTPNPGFEFEVILESNFDVAVYDHRNQPSGGSKIWSRSVDQFSQRAVAATTNGGNTDYFYDFYVPLSVLPGITADTQLRMSGITITSAQSGITGSVSDIGGVNFQAYDYNKQNAWKALMGVFPKTSLNQIKSTGFAQLVAAAPVVTGPITTGSTTITGTSVEAAGSTINVYRNGSTTPIGTTTVQANGSWSITISSTLLSAGDNITATVTPTNKSVSLVSNSITVTVPAICMATPAPTITGQTTSKTKYLTGTTPYVGTQKISIYTATGSTTGYTYTLEGSYIFTTTTANAALPTSTTGMSSVTDIVTLSKAGNYVITTTPVSSTGAATSCESLRSNQLCYQNGGNGPVNSYVPTISNVTGTNGSVYNTLTEAPQQITTITGTLATYTTGITVVLLKNGTQQTYRATPSTTAPYTWTMDVTGLTLSPGDIIYARSEVTLSCGLALSSSSNLVYIKGTTATPTINSITSCGAIKSISGTSGEPGSVVTIYTSGTSTGLSATVSSGGNWVVDVSSLNSGAGIAAGVPITARAKIAGKATSAVSNSVQSAAAPTGAITIISPITQGATTISGKAPAGTQLTLYIEGTPFTPVPVDASGNWSVVGLDGNEVFAGASVTATYKTSATDACESAKATPVVVGCSPPDLIAKLILPTTTICGGSTITADLQGAKYGITYKLLVNGVESGSSVLGNDGTITLTSGTVENLTTANKTVTVTYRARKVSGTTCDAISTSSATVTVKPQPLSDVVFSSTSTSGCANSTFSATITNTRLGYTYQLLNQATGNLVGSPMPGANTPTGLVPLSTGAVSANTTFGLVIINTNANTCSYTLPSQFSVTTTGPSTTRAVTAESGAVCLNGATNIKVSTENNSNYTYTVYRSTSPNTGVAIGSFTGDGTVRSVTTGPLGTAGTTTFYVTVSSASCGTQRLVNEATVVVGNQAASANAGTDQVICGATSATLQAQDPSPGTGMWRQLSGNPVGAQIVNPDKPITSVTGLKSGNYKFIWKVTASCAAATDNTTAEDTVAIFINCPAVYTVAPPKYMDEYKAGDVLASVVDPDGAITDAVIAGGIPPGTKFNTLDGSITRALYNPLVPGTYKFTVTTTDIYGVKTETPLVIRIYENSPAVTPLPVELVYFTAVVQNNQVQLQWKTASEENNKEFEVQRSTEGKTFVTIGTVKGSGTTTIEQLYSFTDNTPVLETTYYQLKQVDFDGHYALSKVVSVSPTGIAREQELQVYPNPFTTELNITVTAKASGEATVRLFDLQGRVVHTGKVQLQPGINELKLPMNLIRRGVYILKLQGNGFNAARKVMKVQ
ncbi:beta strand repeat-containing protein [Pontibacter chitinilyticus]|uniref:beta strand repeat-containing protein n=1 Tax=Pontibacter chitinilyticus TaxID=2674989 RepID=UPI00321A0CB1